jgi:hypothetical protein
MAIARLSTGRVWVWSPIALTQELAAAVEAIGPVGYIVTPNKLHHLFLPEWRNRWPDARLYAPPGLARKKKQVHFDAELGDEQDEAWTTDIDQVVFHGSFAMEEVVFFHRESRTVIFGDLIQRFPEECHGLEGASDAPRRPGRLSRKYATRLAPEFPVAGPCARLHDERCSDGSPSGS